MTVERWLKFNRYSAVPVVIACLIALIMEPGPILVIGLLISAFNLYVYRLDDAEKLNDLLPDNAPAIPQREQLLQVLKFHHLPFLMGVYASQLPLSCEIDNHFEEAEGRLLVTGESGTGKTLALLRLKSVLLQKAMGNEQAPIPLLLSLESWQPKHEFFWDWIVDSAAIRYGIPRPVVTEWLADEQLILLLDDFDHLSPDYQAPCLESMQKLFEGLIEEELTHTVVVFCSVQPDLLTEHFKKTLHLLPLNDAQINTFLEKYTVLKNRVFADSDLLELARRPLWLSMLQQTYGETLSLPSTITQQQILEDYEKQQWKQHSDSPYSQDRMRHYLSWLGSQMQRCRQHIFHIEDFDKDWLAHRNPWLGVLTPLIVFLSITLFSALVLVLSMVLLDPYNPEITEPRDLIDTLSGALFIGAFLAGIITFISQGKVTGLKEVEPLRLSVGEAQFSARTAWPLFFFGMSLVSVLFGIPLILLVGFVQGVQYAIIINFTLGASLFIRQVVTAFFAPGNIETHPRSNRYLDYARDHVLFDFFTGGFLGVIAFTMPILIQIEDITLWAFFALVVVLLIGTSGALNRGGIAMINHLLIRHFLYREGHIPRDYAHFLDNAVQSGFLTPAGNGFQFKNVAIQEYFASLYQVQPEPMPKDVATDEKSWLSLWHGKHYQFTIPYSITECRTRITHAIESEATRKKHDISGTLDIRYIEMESAGDDCRFELEGESDSHDIPSFRVDGFLKTQPSDETAVSFKMTPAIYHWILIIFAISIGIWILSISNLDESVYVSCFTPFGVVMLMGGIISWAGRIQNRHKIASLIQEALDLPEDKSGMTISGVILNSGMVIGTWFVLGVVVSWGLNAAEVVSGANVLVAGLATVTAIIAGLIILFGYAFAQPLLLIGVIHFALARNRYDRALRAITIAQWLNPFLHPFMQIYNGLRGEILLTAGRYQEAEIAFRASIEKPKYLDRVSNSNSYTETRGLADALMGQGKMEAAGEYLERLSGVTEPMETCISRAYWHLLQGHSPEKVLEILEVAKQHHLNRGWFSRKTVEYDLQRVYALQAWAWVLQGNVSAAEESLKNALVPSDRVYNPGEALLYVFVARVKMGDLEMVKDYLNRAIELDPTGRAGEMAYQLMEQIG